MTKRMLIDAGHPEETRVVVLSDNRLEDFDYETREKKPLKGNIYLAKVTRVEPSLQAAFVEYGGNRHGFLPFSEIHPDYYRLPISDREALLEEEQAAQKAEEEREADSSSSNGNGDGEDDALAQAAAEGAKRRSSDEAKAEEGVTDAAVEQVETANAVETISGDEMDEAVRRRAAIAGRYKIQEVIKRRQVMLVQVVKEERGNKGAALTTYLSLAGRYCVLMPNTNKGGGISRKIASPQDRKRLKGVLSELNIPEGIAVIVRTAGSNRTKVEIKRDYEYLLRLWDQIRATTLESTAPCLIYEEANLIKRAIRDVYTREMEEVLVEGEEGYKAAKAFMRSLMPSHAKKVQKYEDPKVPLLLRYNVEEQLDNIHNPTVQLKSGGYVVINQTEALVAIDVNSGRATKERHIEETAFKTNLEAADEIAHQLKLRDLAGLVVIDFIDMDSPRNNREVEARLKEAMRQDRARIQLGRISPFGLLELSRQRLRASLHETSTVVCHTCGGSGFVRSPNSTAMHILRVLEEEGIRNGGGEIQLTLPTAVALYTLNDKRDRLLDIERRYGFRVRIVNDDSLIPPAYVLDRLSSEPVRPEAAVDAEDAMEVEAFAEIAGSQAEEADEAEEETASAANGEASSEGGEGGKSRKRSRRSGRKRRKDGGEEAGVSARAQTNGEDRSAETGDAGESETDQGKPDNTGESQEAASAEGEAASASQPTAAETEEEERARRRRRRGKRGGRRRAKRRDGEEQEAGSEPEGSEARDWDSAESGEGDDGSDGSEEAAYGVDEAVADAEGARPAEPAQQAEPLVAEQELAPSVSEAVQDSSPSGGVEAAMQAETAAEDAPSETVQSPDAPPVETPSEPAPETALEQPEAGAEEAEAKPAPRKRRAPAKPRKSRAKPKAPVADGEEQPLEAAEGAEAGVAEEAAESGEGEAAAKPAPKKRASRKTTGTSKTGETKVRATTSRTRRKPAPKEETEAAPQAETGGEEPVAAEPVSGAPAEAPAPAEPAAAEPAAPEAVAVETAAAGNAALPESTETETAVSEQREAAEPRGVDDLEAGADTSEDDDSPKRRGWWQRLIN